jgi:hypothetical protein
MPAGRYRLTLALVGHNFDASMWSLDLDYDGMWAAGAPQPEASLQITRPKRF